MKRLYFIFCAIVCTLFFPLEVSAQNNEIIRLKDGTEIIGIVERISDGNVKVTDANGDIFIFSSDEIVQITNEKQKAKQEKVEKRKSSGYSPILEVGVGYSFQGGAYFSAGMINAFKLSPYFYLGVGVDIRTTAEYYAPEGESTQAFSIPLYVHLRYSILGGRPNTISPFIAFNGGYDLLGNTGMLLEPYVGIEMKLKKGSFWIAADLPIYTGGYAWMDLGLKIGWLF